MLVQLCERRKFELPTTSSFDLTDLRCDFSTGIQNRQSGQGVFDAQTEKFTAHDVDVKTKHFDPLQM